MNVWEVPREIVARYATRAPRYTSYPPVPAWQQPADLEAVVQEAADPGRSLSLYLHVPFCEELCWYCACTKVITRNRATVVRYLAGLEVEVAQWARRLGEGRRVVQIHWGGGTPTHLDPEELAQAFRVLTAPFVLAPDVEISVEAHPAVTTVEHVDALAELGFTRLSMGVQDYDPVVQAAIHRRQTAEQTQALAEHARRRGFRSVNIDLVYGLPRQTLAGFAATLDAVEALAPDRVALFHYAHVPAMAAGQRLIDEATLPDSAAKLDLFELAVARLHARGLRLIGMDHFARAEDELSRALDAGTLRRNFMGYTTRADSDVIGVGMSSISDLGGAFVQNERNLGRWQQAMEEGRSALVKGHRLTAEDRLRRDVILGLACHLFLDKRSVEAAHGVAFDAHFAVELRDLAAMAEDGLVRLGPDRIDVLPRGQMLLRNVCAVFDPTVRATPEHARTGSRTL